MCAILDTLPPKVLLLRSGIKAQPVELDATPLDERVQVVLKKIQNATFTSKKDNHKVLDMYKQYVTRTVQTLEKTLHFAAAALSEVQRPSLSLPRMPAVAVEPVQLRLADGQMLLLLSDTDRATPLMGPEGAPPRWCKVSGATLYFLDGGHADGTHSSLNLGIASFSQAVIPWRPPPPGWEVPLRQHLENLILLLTAVDEPELDEPDDVSEIVNPVFLLARRLEPLKEQLEASSVAFVKAYNPLHGGSDVLNKLEQLFEAAREADSGVATAEWRRTEISRMAMKQKRAQHAQEKQKRAQHAQEIRTAVTGDMQRAESIWRSSHAVGARSYASGQWLTVRQASGTWEDVKVRDPQEILHPWQHAPRVLPKADFDALRQWWSEWLCAQHSHLTDAISGRKLDILQQLVAVRVNVISSGNPSTDDVKDARSLSEWLHQRYAVLSKGGEVKSSPGTLLSGRKRRRT
jgi:hypothetical protein